MHKLTIFDNNISVATITLIGTNVFIFARSSREWSEIKRMTSYFDSKDNNFLEKLAEKAHSFNYSTELLNE